MDPMRRKIVRAGAAATAMAAMPRMFAQQTGQGGAPMSFYEMATFGSAMRKPGPASPCCSSPAEDSIRRRPA